MNRDKLIDAINAIISKIQNKKLLERILKLAEYLYIHEEKKR